MQIDKAFSTLNWLAEKKGLTISSITFDIGNIIQVVYTGNKDTITSPLYKAGLYEAIHSEIRRFCK